MYGATKALKVIKIVSELCIVHVRDTVFGLLGLQLEKLTVCPRLSNSRGV